MRNFASIILFCFTSIIAFSQTVIRGPYMQTPTENSIIIMWRTDVNTSTKVWYGSSPASLTSFVEINNNVTDHTIQITGLSPFTQYYYAVGSIGGVLAGQTPNHRFTTNPLPGTEQPIRVWAIGDFGKGNTGQIDVKNAYVNYADSTHTDVWMWLGDNAYQNGEDNEYQTKVFAHTGFSDIFSWLPFWPTPGNHDYGEVWQQSALFGIPYSNIPLQNHEGPYFEIVDVPEQAEAGGHPSNLEVFYSFDYGNVHFLSLNSEVFDFTLTYNGIHEMRDWIIQDLQQNTQLFTVAYFHQPPYSKGSHDSDDAYELAMKAMREEIIPTLEDFDVDMIICGHSHVFERSYLIHGHYGNSGSFNTSTMLMDGGNGNFDQSNPYIKDDLPSTPDGSVYVVCGNSGSNETAPALNHPVMAYTDGGSTAMGSFVMDIYKNRLDGKYLKVNGTIGDDFTILKKNLHLSGIANYSICEGDSLFLQANFTGGSDSISYNWLPLNNTNPSIHASPISTTNYTLTVTDLLTGQTENTSFTIDVNAIPIPLITQSFDSLQTNQGYTYQWYQSGVPILGANNYFYVPATSGVYTVEIINGACSNTSSNYIFDINTIGVDENSNDLFFVYPNPAQDLIFFNTTGEGQLLIFDILGKQRFVSTTNNQLQVIDISEWVNGVYTYHIVSKNISVAGKFIKQ